YEEILISLILSVDLSGYAKASALFNIGFAFSKIGNWSKADHYFNLIRTSTFDISDRVISEFYRYIGELYYNLGEGKKALSWLKEGLDLNSKLPVKNLVKKLESCSDSF